MHWRHSGSPTKTKFKQILSTRKVLCTVFWDRKGILLIKFLARGETVNAERYCATLQNLRRTIQNKRREMQVLSTCTITLSHIRLGSQQFFCSSSAGRCLTIHPIARISPPAISIFSCTSRNSCPVSITHITVTQSCRRLSHTGSYPRRQTSTTQEYKS